MNPVSAIVAGSALDIFAPIPAPSPFVWRGAGFKSKIVRKRRAKNKVAKKSRAVNARKAKQ